MRGDHCEWKETILNSEWEGFWGGRKWRQLKNKINYFWKLFEIKDLIMLLHSLKHFHLIFMNDIHLFCTTLFRFFCKAFVNHFWLQQKLSSQKTIFSQKILQATFPGSTTCPWSRLHVVDHRCETSLRNPSWKLIGHLSNCRSRCSSRPLFSRHPPRHFCNN